MNKIEFEDFEYYIKEVEASDEGNDALERLYSYVKKSTENIVTSTT